MSKVSSALYGGAAVQVAPEPAVPGDFTCTRIGDDLLLRWPQHGVEIAFSHLREGSEGIHSEIVVTSDIFDDELEWSKLNLASTSARALLQKKLDRACPTVPWQGILNRACRLAAQELRRGEPVVALMPARAPETRYLISKLCLAGETNILHADGGSGKSLLALVLAIAASAGVELPAGIKATAQAPVLFLDYESCLEEHQERLAGLMAGFGLTAVPPILYRPMARALADDGAFLRAEISRHQVGLVIVDSLAPASGPEPEGADAAVRVMNVMRSFGRVTRLVIAHVSKAAADQRGGAAKPFGSAFVFNLARSVWEIRRGEDTGDDLVLGLFHRKTNHGRLFPPLGLRFTFDQDAIHIGSRDLDHQPDLMARTSLAYQITRALSGGAKTAADLAADLEKTEDTVSRTLRRLGKADKVIRIDDARTGRGREAVWGLRT